MSAPILEQSKIGRVSTEPVYPLSVAQYHRMIDLGLLTADDPVELLEGILVQKMPKNPPHPRCNKKLARIFDRLLPAAWHYRSQEPITLGDGEPEPDGAVVRGTEDDYAQRHPGPADVALVIEIADSTLSRDRGTKLRSYARAGIAVYWIVNLIDRVIEVHSDPAPDSEQPNYRVREVIGAEGKVELKLNGAQIGTIEVADVI